MGIAQVLLILTQLVQAGFALKQISDDVHAMQAKGATDQDVHDYLRALAKKNLDDLKAA